MIPIVEFCGADDHAKTRRVASVIKDRNNREVRSATTLPPEYRDFPTAVYSEVVVGPYAHRSMAVVVKEDDRDTMLRHALVRLKFRE